MTINAKNINQLEEASTVENGDLIPVYKDGTARKAAAELFRGVGIQGVEETTVSTESGGVNIITVTMTDGTTATFSVKNGAKGDTGRAFQVVKTYASVTAMEADFSGTDTQTGDFVMISSTVEDPDNAKLYVKGDSAFTFVSDLSGQQGMKGDDGEDGTGIASITSGTDAQGNTTVTISLTDGTTQSFTVSKGTNATINGVTTLTLTGTDGVTATQSGSTLTLSAPEIAVMKAALSRMDLPMEASGNPATITDAAAAPVRALTVDIEPVQAAGTPSPTNPLPISSWTAAVITRTGEGGVNPETVTVSFDNAGTVCGGTLDVLTGTLTVTHRKVTLDPNKVNGNAGRDGTASGYYAAYVTNVMSDYPAQSGDSTAILCDTLPPLFVYNLYTQRGAYIYGDTTSFYNACVRVHIDDVPGWTGGTTFNDSANIVKQFLTDTPTSICYTLATPITYTLTPAQLSTLAGTNVISADCGTVTLTYKGDPEIIFGS